jgi:hypothetical protein
MVVYLLHGHFLPEDRLAEVMRDLFGVSLVPATIARMSRCCADRLQSFIDTVREEVCRAKVKHLDETGFRLGGKTQWLHIASTALLTFYRVCANRGSLMAGVVGIVVHDHWKPYYMMKDVLHALCNAHHLRELKALIELDHEDWARKMQILLRRACHAVNLARERGIPLNRDWSRASSGVTTPSWRRGSPFMRRWRRCAAPNVAAGSRDASAITSSCACISAGATCCGFCTIRVCPSPTTKPKPTPA